MSKANAKPKEYRIVYGGQMTVKALNPDEAYLLFWRALIVRIHEGRVGLITEIDGKPADWHDDGSLEDAHE